MVPENSTKFSVALQRGADPDVAELHLHLLAELGRVPPVVVLNTRSQGLWGEEQLHTLPFPLAPRTFLLSISAYMDSYEIEVAGSSVTSFKVRDGLPVSSITHLAIQAELAVRAIHIPVENMPRNLRLSLGSGLKIGDTVTIRGQPTEDAKNFVVKWQNGPAKFDDILYQLQASLNEKQLVFNSRLDDVTGVEETAQGCPFRAGVPFQTVTGVTGLGFETRVDEGEWNVFKHRQDIESGKTLFLEGDMQPIDICIDSVKLNPAGIVNEANLKSRGIRLQCICLDIPSTSRITAGFEKDCLLLVSGTVNTHPSRMQISAQCGDGSEDSDIALQYLVQWEADGSPAATLNSKEDDQWGKPVKVTLEDGLRPGLQFDLLVRRTDAGLQCFLDGLEQATLPYRIDNSKPNHVAVSGDIQVHRLLVL